MHKPYIADKQQEWGKNYRCHCVQNIIFGTNKAVFNMFYGNNPYYYFIIGLQALCVIHCLRKGRENGWIWFIIFVPFIGSVAYIFTEIFSRRDLQNVGDGLGAVVFSAGRIKKLEQQLKFSDTFNNRVALADAYLGTGQVDKAIHLYESSLTGAFTENEYVLKQLIVAYYNTQRYNDVLPIARKIYRLPQFARSRAHILYAVSLDKTGNTAQAEQEFLQMKGRFDNFEARSQYALLLERTGRLQEAKKIWNELLEEESQLTSRERRAARTWFSQAREALKRAGA